MPEPSPDSADARPAGGDDARSPLTSVPTQAVPRAARDGLLALGRPLPWVLVAGLVVHRASTTATTATAQADLRDAVVLALGERGLEASPDDVHWIDEPSGLFGSRTSAPRAVVLARRPSEASDVHVVTSRLSPEGRLLEIGSVHGLSDTSAADEGALAVGAGQAAWTIAGGGKTYIVHYADLHVGPRLEGERWSRVKRWQQRITNWQRTGRAAGITRRAFKLDPAADSVTLTFTEAALHIAADDRRIRIPRDGGPIDGQRFIVEETPELSVPGNLVTWTVDRVRQSPWFSDDQMQLAKAVAFMGLDFVQRMSGAVTGDDGSADVAADLGSLATALVEHTDPDTGWPPPPMEPMLKPVLEGEGQWLALDDDPFVLKNEGAPPPFVMSFIRTDQKRAYTRTYVVLWDPRQVELSTMSGTVEPKSATGETGKGLVPRRPEVVGRLLAGFNGGFQATHGEFGMVSDRVVYLPPKPYAATVARMEDGSTGFGTWPATEDVPPEIVDLRQNMTPLVMDDVVNPYRRNWWGGVPPGWTDESRTVRSAVCLTKEGFVAYLYGASIDADHLAFAMQRVRCSYGIHLDMNPGHTGLEFYRVGRDGELPPVGRALDPQWEATGPVVDMPGWSFLGRRMVRYMGLMNFPRYIDREARDFFYLTLRHVLPGAAIETPGKAEPGEGEWRTKGLPQHGFPYAVATSWIRPDAARPETKVRVLGVDPRTVRLRARTDERSKTVLVLHHSGSRGDEPIGLWLANGSFVISREPPEGAGEPLARGGGSSPSPRAAFGVATNGMLYYAEVVTAHDGAKDGEMLDGVLHRLGCTDTLRLGEGAAPALGGDRDLSGHPVVLPARPSTTLVRRDVPGARRIFGDTPIVAPGVWYPLQAKRVRYFRKEEPPAPAEGQDAAEPAPAPGVP